ncbi:MAG: rhomboid family intramembrane serine protease [Acidobacteria bacterium]|nr:rhomboid family intramembrane serine protease [Acidobacteriota bacterium]
MRYPGGSSFATSSMSVPQGVKWLLIANTAVFVAYYLAMIVGWGALFSPFRLVPEQTVEGLRVWQPLTYLFLHDPFGFSHILLNMLSLYMFGKTLEETWGTERFLRFYFICGVGAGLCVIVAGYLTNTEAIATIGASGAIFGLLLAFGMLFPDATVLYSFLFPIKAKYLVMIIGAITFLSSLKVNSGVSHIAHLGGMLVAFLLLRTAQGKAAMNRRGPSRPSLKRQLEQAWADYKLRRARKKFQVYMSKQNRKDGPYVN